MYFAKPRLLLILLLVLTGFVTTHAQSDLSAKEIARKLLPSVGLVICSDCGPKGSLGSGFFIEPGIFVTNHHVIKGGSSGVVQVTVGVRQEVLNLRVARIISFYDDTGADLAILSVPAAKNYAIPSLLLAPAYEGIEIGETVYALGNPDGQVGTISQGIVSAAPRNRDRSLEDERIQINAAISNGSSGGPVVNGKGEVIGVAVDILMQTDPKKPPFQNLNHAIPVSLLHQLIRERRFFNDVPTPIDIVSDYRGAIVPWIPSDPLSGVKIITPGPPSKNTPAPVTPIPPEPKDDPKVIEVRNKSIGMVLVKIRPGEFMMGSAVGEKYEKPAHSVTFPDGFWMGKYEVTQSQWFAIMGSNPSHFGKSCGGDCPVENVSWEDAKRFIDKLNAKNDGFVYSLPTEAQWEYAARAGNAPTSAIELESTAWYIKNSDGKTHPAGTKQPNPFGLYDMLGNVWEWCEDWYADYTVAAVTDPKGPDKGKYRVLRGGAWKDRATDVRTTFRGGLSPTTKYKDSGFRIVARPR